MGKSPRCHTREGMWIAGSDKARGCSAGAKKRGEGAPVRWRGAQQMSKEQGGWEQGEGGGS